MPKGIGIEGGTRGSAEPCTALHNLRRFAFDLRGRVLLHCPVFLGFFVAPKSVVCVGRGCIASGACECQSPRSWPPLEGHGDPQARDKGKGPVSTGSAQEHRGGGGLFAFHYDFGLSGTLLGGTTP